jgi:hypothetical protein
MQWCAFEWNVSAIGFYTSSAVNAQECGTTVTGTHRFVNFIVAGATALAKLAAGSPLPPTSTTNTKEKITAQYTALADATVQDFRVQGMVIVALLPKDGIRSPPAGV